MLWSRGNAYARSGRRREAEDSIAKLKAIAKTQYVIRSFIASIYGALDQKEEAFDELKQALDEREPWLKWINADPTMDPLREDPRFKGVLRRLNLAK